jgi:hypothetical protein
MMEVQSSNLEELAEQLDRRKSHIEKAMRKAASSFVVHIRSEVLGEVRKRFGLPRAEMNRVRIRTKIVRNRLEASMWVGSSPVAVRYLTARWTKAGVKAAGQTFPNAFLPRKKKGSSLILQRTGKERLPVVAPEVDINDTVLEVLDRKWPKLEAYFDNAVRRELSKID